MKIQRIEISGMTCGHCVMNVKKELSKIDGISVNEVAIGSAVVDRDETRASNEQIIAAVEEAGYSVVAIR